MNKIKNQIKSVLLAGGIFAGSFSLIACGKSNTAEVDQNNFFQNCTNCTNFSPPGTGNDLIRTVSKDSQGLVQMSLSFMSQNYGSYNVNVNSNANYGYGALAKLNNYSGLTAAHGQVTFLQNFNLNSIQNNYCLLPAGVYQVRPVQAAQWSQGQISNLKIFLTGPSQIVMNLNYAQIQLDPAMAAVANGNSVLGGRLVGNALVETINGNSCQIVLNLN